MQVAGDFAVLLAVLAVLQAVLQADASVHTQQPLPFTPAQAYSTSVLLVQL
jgi:hypothetical protein